MKPLDGVQQEHEEWIAGQRKRRKTSWKGIVIIQVGNSSLDQGGRGEGGEKW